jgi:hypothetical protein
MEPHARSVFSGCSASNIGMIKLWALTAGILACVAGIAALRGRRKRTDSEFSTEPVSTEWLAQARGREEHGW